MKLYFKIKSILLKEVKIVIRDIMVTFLNFLWEEFKVVLLEYILIFEKERERAERAGRRRGRGRREADSPQSRDQSMIRDKIKSRCITS